MKITFELDTVSQEVTINGVKYVPIKDWRESANGEIVEITEIKAEYRLGSTWLCLSFEMPAMKFKPRDKIRIVKE